MINLPDSDHLPKTHVTMKCEELSEIYTRAKQNCRYLGEISTSQMAVLDFTSEYLQSQINRTAVISWNACVALAELAGEEFPNILDNIRSAQDDNTEFPPEDQRQIA